VVAFEQFRQVVWRHGQLELIADLLRLPADVVEQAEVFAELQAEALGGGEVLVLLQRDPDVADPAEVVADQLVEPCALLLVDRGRGHGAPPLGQGTEGRRDAAASNDFGE
jgi:hypothetical protein